MVRCASSTDMRLSGASCGQPNGQTVVSIRTPPGERPSALVDFRPAAKAPTALSSRDTLIAIYASVIITKLEGVAANRLDRNAQGHGYTTAHRAKAAAG